jgi:lipopolysaccharide transport system ATP-binding protein
MSEVVRVENLGKKYLISHQATPLYRTLRESLTERAKRFVRGRGKPSGGSPGREEFWALRDISFGIKRGDRLGIIGRNGAGKSTLLKLLSRITEPTTGRMILRGRVASLLEVGTGFHPELTGRENIFLNGALLGMRRSEIRSRFDEIVAFSEIENFLDTPVKRYSSGMYTRLAFAVAAHLDPDILILDEVLAVGDAQFQRKCLGKMDEVSRTGKTILFVSHNMGAIRQICNVALVLSNGRGLGPFPCEEAVAVYQSQAQASAQERIKAGPIVVYDLRINDRAVSESPEVFSGDPLTIKMSYSSTVLNLDIFVSFGIRHLASDTLIEYSHNHLEGVKHRTIKSGTIQARFPSFRLTPGRYALETQLRLDDRMVLTERRVAEFTVEPTPAFRSQILHTAFPSLILADTDWSFEPNEDPPQL